MSPRTLRSTLRHCRRPIVPSPAFLSQILEPRRLLAAVSWDGGAGTLEWTDPNNWSTNALPGANDDVTINIAGTPTVTLSADVQSIKSLTSSENLTIQNNAELDVAQASTLTGNLAINAGTIGANGNLTVSGSFNWTGGNVSGTGTLRINGAATIAPPNDQFYGTGLSGHLVLAGNSNFIGSNSSLRMYGLSTLEVASGGTLTFGPASWISDNGGSGEDPVLVNHGTIKSIDASTNAQVDVAIAGGGTYALTAGVITFNGGASPADAAPESTNPANVGLVNTTATLAGTSKLDFHAGTFDFYGTSTVGSGTVDMTGGIQRFNTASAIGSNTHLNGGTITGVGVLTLAAFSWTGGTMTTDNATVGITRVNGVATIAPPADQFYGTGLAGSRHLELYGDANFVGSNSSLRIYAAAVLEVKPGGSLTFGPDSWISDNGGSGEDPVLINNGTIKSTNAATVANIDVSLSGNGAYVLTAGKVVLNGGGTAVGATNPANAGLGASSSATLSAGATLDFHSGVYDVAAMTTSGEGTIAFTQGTVNIDGASTFASAVLLQGGTLSGLGLLTINGPLTWNGGDMATPDATPATTRINGATTIAPPNQQFYGTGLRGSRHVVLAGDTTFVGSDSSLRMYGLAVLEVASGATLTLGPDSWISDNGGSGESPSLLNNGTIAFNSTGATANIDPRTVNHGLISVDAGSLKVGPLDASGGFLSGGQIRVARYASFDVIGGITDFTGDIEFQKDSLVPALANLTTNRGRISLAFGSADLTITPIGGLFSNEGIIDLSANSVFEVNGNMTMAGPSQPIIRTEIAGPTLFGKIVVHGTLDLTSEGTSSRFDPDFAVGYNAPPVGESYAVLNADDGIDDAFDAFFGGATFDGNHMEFAYNGVYSRGTSASVRIVAGPAPAAPQLLSQTFEYQTRLAVVFQFSQSVSAFLSRKDYTITNLATGQDLPNTAGVLTYNQASNQATLLLNGIPNGNYQLVVKAADIANAAGVPLTSGGAPLPFFVLAGDVNRDHAVNFTDLLILAKNYNSTGKTLLQGNADYDPTGTVDFADLLILAKNYGRSVPAAPFIAASSDDATPARRRSTAGVLE